MESTNIFLYFLPAPSVMSGTKIGPVCLLDPGSKHLEISLKNESLHPIHFLLTLGTVEAGGGCWSWNVSECRDKPVARVPESNDKSWKYHHISVKFLIRSSPTYLTSEGRIGDFWIIPSLLLPRYRGNLVQKNHRMIFSRAFFKSSVVLTFPIL